MFSTADTIAAIASASGGGLRGIVRLSGSETTAIIRRCFSPTDGDADLSKFAHPTVVKGYIRLLPPAFDRERVINCDLWIWPGARSYTREPAAEIHTLGSSPLLEAVLESVCRAGARLAQPGEFTLRAFLAGRIDLTQAEAVLSVVDSTNRRQLDTALRQLAGGLSRPLAAVVDELLNLLADLEAGLDFADEDIRFVAHEELESRLSRALEEVAAVANQLTMRMTSSPVTRVVLIGRPNAGKSSLFNALAGREAAIVSRQPGATRDYLVSTLDLDGISVELIDTAGIGEAGVKNMLQTLAQSASVEQHSQATLRLLCLEAISPISDWEREETRRESTLIVFTKNDCLPSAEFPHAAFTSDAVVTSSLTGEGLPGLKNAIRSRVLAEPGDSERAGTAMRAIESTRLTTEFLQRAVALARQRESDELIAAEIRAAWSELGTVLGTVYTDDLLDRIFSRFCIGK